MKIRVPTRKAAGVGMRRLSDPATIEQVRRSLSQAAFRARANWPRLIKECEANIATVKAMLRVIDRLDADNELQGAIALQDAVATQAIVRKAMFGS